MINKEDANILIVDDIEDNRYTLERRLKRDGYKNIFLAEGGKTALDSGCNDYDTKPVDINRLLSKISEQLGTKND